MNQLALFGGSKAVTRPWLRWPRHDEAEAAGLARVLNSGKWWLYAYGGGPRPDDTTSADISEVEHFEREFAAAHFVKHCYAVTSGTNALEIVLQACDIGPGDEVITTGYTFIARSNAAGVEDNLERVSAAGNRVAVLYEMCGRELPLELLDLRNVGAARVIRSGAAAVSIQPPLAAVEDARKAGGLRLIVPGPAQPRTRDRFAATE